VNKLAIPTKFKVTPTNLEIMGEVTEEEYLRAWEFLGHMQGKLLIYIGDLARQSEKLSGGRGLTDELVDKIIEISTYTRQTIKDAKYIMNAIKPSLRNDSLSFNHYKLIAPLPEETRADWINKCAVNGWSVKTLKNEINKALPRPPLPDGKYDLMYADPPWAYDTPESSKEVSQHYPTLEQDDIAKYTDDIGKHIKELAWDDCVLYMWATTARLNWAIPVIEAWGFKYLTSMIWDKVEHNMGHYCSARHEILLIAGKGKSSPLDTELANDIDSVQVIPKSTIHSKKPEEFYEILERLYPERKKVELFSRNKRPGWDSWGFDV